MNNLAAATSTAVLICFVTGFHLGSEETGCATDANDESFPEPDPLFLRPGTRYSNVTDYEGVFVLPEQSTGLLKFRKGEQVRIACPGTTVSVTGTEEVTVTCDHNRFVFDKNGGTEIIGSFACESKTKSIARRKDICVLGATGIDLGFQIGNDIFPLVYTCFDEVALETYYSLERVPAELSGYESGEKSPSFQKGDFFPDTDINQLYKYNNQLEAFTILLGNNSLAKEYLQDRKKYFLARGHFAPRADFVLGAHTRATFYYVNVAPQWQIFNGGVWNDLEASVRDYAISKGTDLIVYTGPWDVLSYPDINGEMVEIYLGNPGTSEQTLKVPKYYWKVVYDPSTHAGVAFIGINDPYVGDLRPDDYVLCDDVLGRISWLHVKDHLNLLYACDANEFAEISETFPKLDVRALLEG